MFKVMGDSNLDPHTPMGPSSSSSSLDRRPSGDEDSAAMTIEFLRKRLLSERSVSKAARQRAQQLSKKIAELEESLEAEVCLRRKLETDRLEILSKYKAELIEEYGELFASSYGEDLSRNGSHTLKEEESSSMAEHSDRGYSSQTLNQEEANDEDEETNQLGQEKGVLFWGRPKGSRRDFGHGPDWLGRSLSQRSHASTDGESPQKKWAGKSVRQIRKRESSNLEEAGQSQISEDFDCKSGQLDDMKGQLQCEDERDTEVERVLERQAELIEQFEAEENAQRAWEEAKFKEEKAKANHGIGITQSLGMDGAIETESQGGMRDLRKVHPESNFEELQGGLLQPEILQRKVSDYTSGIESEKNKIAPTTAVEKEGKSEVVESTKEVKGPNERLTETDLPADDGRLYKGGPSSGVFKDGVSQEQVLSNTDTEEREEHAKASGKARKFKKILSSSFRFTVFEHAEPVTSSSPPMPGFAMYKPEADKAERDREGEEGKVGKELRAISEPMSGFGLSEFHHDKSNYHNLATASLDHLSSVHGLLVSEGCTLSTKEAESQEKSKDMLHEVTREQENLTAENGVTNHSSNHQAGNDAIGGANREEMLKTMLGAGGGPHLGRHCSDFPSHEFRGPGTGLQTGSGGPYSDLPHSSAQQVMDLDGMNFDHLASLPSYRSRVVGPVLNPNTYDDTAFRSRSVDGGFDRVAEVLRALQIAKYQIEGSSEQATPRSIEMPYRNGNDGRRDVYYAEPPQLPSMYTALPQYTSLVPYSFRGAPPLSQNMQHWSYGASSSRQLPYMHNVSWVREPQHLWVPPPSQGGYNSNLYHYDTRQHR